MLYGTRTFRGKEGEIRDVLQAMYKLDDEKHAIAGIKGETGPIGGSIVEHVQDLILLGRSNYARFQA